MPDVSQTINKLPPFLRDLLIAPPRAGEGVHFSAFRVARQLHAHLPAGEIVNLLENLVANCGRQSGAMKSSPPSKTLCCRVAAQRQPRADSIHSKVAGRE